MLSSHACLARLHVSEVGWLSTCPAAKSVSPDISTAAQYHIDVGLHYSVLMPLATSHPHRFPSPDYCCKSAAHRRLSSFDRILGVTYVTLSADVLAVCQGPKFPGRLASCAQLSHRPLNLLQLTRLRKYVGIVSQGFRQARKDPSSADVEGVISRTRICGIAAPVRQKLFTRPWVAIP